MSLHSSSSVNGEGSTPKDPLYKILDELRSLKLWKAKQERKEKGKKRVEEIKRLKSIDIISVIENKLHFLVTKL